MFPSGLSPDGAFKSWQLLAVFDLALAFELWQNEGNISERKSTRWV